MKMKNREKMKMKNIVVFGRMPVVIAAIWLMGFDASADIVTGNGLTAAPDAQIEVRVRQTSGGPRIFVDGKAVTPRFYYGSPPCLGPISKVEKSDLVIPFKPDEDTDSGRVAIDGYDDDEPMWFSCPFIEDRTVGVTNVLQCAGEERTRHFVRDGLSFKKGHYYHFHVTHRAARFRTYFRHEVSYVAANGEKRVLPLPYGDTLSDTARMAGKAGVNLVTFSPDTSWGWEDWWMPEGEETDYEKLFRHCDALIAANPHVLFIPRVSANAPAWMLARDPSLKMKFDKGYTIPMSSISSRSYRKAACAAIEKLARRICEKYPRNFAGLQVTGQNSAEWFYMLSQTGDLSGYDVHTRDAFRGWLAARGAKDAATAEVPSPMERRVVRPDYRWDPVKDRRLIEFGQFRQEEMASFICELGAAVRRGTNGKSLALFFYGYTWELGATGAGAAETGHFFVDWLLKHGRDSLDGLSSPISYNCRAWPGDVQIMSAAETIMRGGLLWINEDDMRTHHEDIRAWPIGDYTGSGFINDSPWITRNMFLRNSAVSVLRGYGDWWMDLFGHGWFRDEKIWDIRRALNPIDKAMLERKRPYSPEIAIVADEVGLREACWGASCVTWPRLNRHGSATCGTSCGQYLLSDVLENPPDAKLILVVYSKGLSPERRAKLDALKSRLSDVRVREVESPDELTALAIAERARAAGVHLYAPPGKAVVCAAEGYVMVHAHVSETIPLDFGRATVVEDALDGKIVGEGPVVKVNFRLGETRMFKVR